MGLNIRGWEQTRRRILERDHYVCQICGRPGADSVDHIVPRAFGGTHGDSNLRAAHFTCNSRRGAKQARRPSAPRAKPSRFA